MFVDEKRHGEAPTKLEPWRQALLDGASLIERRGHCKGFLQDRNGRLCLYGALNFATTGAAYSATSASKQALEAVALSLGASGEEVSVEGGRSAIRWNNKPGRTADDVISFMRKVANG